MFVRAEEREMRIVEPGLVQIDEARRDARARSAPAIAETDVRAARFIGRCGIADLRGDGVIRRAATLECAEVLAGLEDLPARQRNELRQSAFRFLFRRR